MRGIWTLPLVALIAAGCAGGEESADESAERLQSARADSVGMAEMEYDAAVFDTIEWETAEDRLNRGRVVWQFSCQKCHGPDGRGEGSLARTWDLSVPDLTARDWTYQGDLEAIRHRIFVGHESEMPNWGLHGLKYQDIDAVAAHIVNGLRLEPLPDS